jgi:ribokinase
VGTGLVAVARLGGKCRYLGKVGDDAVGTFIRSEFVREGVDVSGLTMVPGMSGICSFCVVNPKTGFRTIFFSLDRVPPITGGDLSKEQVLSGNILYVDGFILEGAIHAARWAREAGRKIVMDAEMTAPDNDILMDLSTHVVASHGFARSRVGDVPPQEAARKLFERLRKKDPAKVVGVTAGVNGSHFISAEGEFHQPAFKVKVVDTTGCGDVFHGAFVFGLSQGWELRRIVRFASAVAAIKARKLGGRAGIPNRKETEDFLAAQGG